MRRAFIVTSTPYSATQYTSKLLTAAGLPCSHEFLRAVRFNRMRFPLPGRPCDRTPWFLKRAEELNITGDCSFHAALMLDIIPKDIPMFHLVRDPLKTLNTLTRSNFMHAIPELAGEGGWGEYTIRRLESRGYTFENRLDHFKAAAEFWYKWHLMILEHSGDRPYYRFRVEDMCPELIQNIYSVLNLVPPGDYFWIQSRIDMLGKTTNHHENKHGQELYNRDNMPEEVLKLGGFFGYMLGKNPKRMECIPQPLLTTSRHFNA